MALEKALKEKEFKEKADQDSDDEMDRLINDGVIAYMEGKENGPVETKKSQPKYKWDTVQKVNEREREEKEKEREKIRLKELQEEEELYGDSSTLQVYLLNEKDREELELGLGGPELPKPKDRRFKADISRQPTLCLKDAKDLFGKNVQISTIPDSDYYPNLHSPDISDTEDEEEEKSKQKVSEKETENKDSNVATSTGEITTNESNKKLETNEIQNKDQNQGKKSHPIYKRNQNLRDLKRKKQNKKKI